MFAFGCMNYSEVTRTIKQLPTTCSECHSTWAKLLLSCTCNP